MSGRFGYRAMAVGLVVSGAVALASETVAGISGGALGQPQAAVPLLIPVQDVGDPGGSTGSGGGAGAGAGGGGEAASTSAAAPATGPASPSVPQATLSPPVTQAIADSVGDAFDACRSLNAGYQIDCMGQQLRLAAEEVASTGAYAPVNRALLDASRKLADIARNQRDSAQPRVSVQHRNQTGIRTYSAVRGASLAQSRAAAARVLDEVQTVLLRSAATAGNRRSHFQTIAASMDSGKVLLRSS